MKELKTIHKKLTEIFHQKLVTQKCPMLLTGAVKTRQPQKLVTQKNRPDIWRSENTPKPETGDPKKPPADN